MKLLSTSKYGTGSAQISGTEKADSPIDIKRAKSVKIFIMAKALLTSVSWSV
jgi:hypothetical protein